MNATLGRKLRFSDAVYAINTTPKTLRNWLQRDLVKLHTLKPEGAAWTEYSFYDIAILALVRALVAWGVSVQTSSAIANSIMTEFFPKLLQLKDPDSMPAGALALSWGNRRLYLFQKDDDWEMRLVTLWESRLDTGDHLLPSQLAELRSEHEPAPVFLSIDVETVLRTAFERAEESLNEGRDEDED